MKVPLRHETFSDNLDFWISGTHQSLRNKRGERCGLTFSTVKNIEKNTTVAIHFHTKPSICELPTFCPNLWISGQTSRLLRVDPRKKESPLCLVINASVGWLLGLEVHRSKENRSMLICIYSTGVISYLYIKTQINAHYYISFLLSLFRSMISVKK